MKLFFNIENNPCVAPRRWVRVGLRGFRLRIAYGLLRDCSRIALARLRIVYGLLRDCLGKVRDCLEIALELLGIA